MNNCIIIEDSRQQAGKHRNKLSYFKKQGIKIIRTKLFVGDFSRLDNQTVCIDTKKNVLELAQNVCGKHRSRFEAECIRAKHNGIKLIVLVEEDYTYYTLRKWKSPVYKSGINKGKPMNPIWGITIAEATMDFTKKFGVEFLFTKKELSGEKIVEILNKNN